ncbi:DUF1800 domain-containing protein [Opitutus sp. ER46]|uniref:DUF1800 domain-containing protein n=1 Tax=Opitutus sp. ER46 TaxID=2161864 RepID=UPI000D318323|nr:DUF1800 domain-containing protein [Opitutus sp. ER46]PTX91077.1 DUF1800 domain-containing protein [Opitutus sp. ER46]
MAFSFPPEKAWLPLPPTHWQPGTARHLLRRAGWTATPDEVARAVSEGLAATLDRLFPDSAPRLSAPASVTELAAAEPELRRAAREKQGEERQRLQRELRDRQRNAVRDLTIQWLTYAATPAQSAAAKWVLFLSDVYVVSADKVNNPALLHEHFDILTHDGFGAAPALTKAVSRSPAMELYLDLNQSRRKAPNENFARELFELFVLGEGHYSEQDIKEAARAFTGYRIDREREFHFVPAQHDPGRKTVFGHVGPHTGDDVIDLAYRQPAASAFLPAEMMRFYLSNDPIPSEHLTALGDEWRRHDFNLRWLTHRFFGSQFFYAAEFRANYIKSPIQFYLGLLQDLGLDVPPIPRMTINPLRQMGQLLFYPPNVRGWVGGKTWINSATIAARRQFVESVFAGIKESVLNADELMDLKAARAAGASRFSVTDDAFASLSKLPPADSAAELTERFLAAPAASALREVLAGYISAGASAPNRPPAVRRAAAILLQSPSYQLC